MPQRTPPEMGMEPVAMRGEGDGSPPAGLDAIPKGAAISKRASVRTKSRRSQQREPPRDSDMDSAAIQADAARKAVVIDCDNTSPATYSDEAETVVIQEDPRSHLNHAMLSGSVSEDVHQVRDMGGIGAVLPAAATDATLTPTDFSNESRPGSAGSRNASPDTIPADPADLPPLSQECALPTALRSGQEQALVVLDEGLERAEAAIPTKEEWGLEASTVAVVPATLDAALTQLREMQRENAALHEQLASLEEGLLLEQELAAEAANVAEAEWLQRQELVRTLEDLRRELQAKTGSADISGAISAETSPGEQGRGAYSMGLALPLESSLASPREAGSGESTPGRGGVEHLNRWPHLKARLLASLSSAELAGDPFNSFREFSSVPSSPSGRAFLLSSLHAGGPKAPGFRVLEEGAGQSPLCRSSRLEPSALTIDPQGPLEGAGKAPALSDAESEGSEAERASSKAGRPRAKGGRPVNKRVAHLAGTRSLQRHDTSATTWETEHKMLVAVQLADAILNEIKAALNDNKVVQPIPSVGKEHLSMDNGEPPPHLIGEVTSCVREGLRKLVAIVQIRAAAGGPPNLQGPVFGSAQPRWMQAQDQARWQDPQSTRRLDRRCSLQERQHHGDLPSPGNSAPAERQGTAAYSRSQLEVHRGPSQLHRLAAPDSPSGALGPFDKILPSPVSRDESIWMGRDGQRQRLWNTVVEGALGPFTNVQLATPLDTPISSRNARFDFLANSMEEDSQSVVEHGSNPESPAAPLHPRRDAPPAVASPRHQQYMQMRTRSALTTEQRSNRRARNLSISVPGFTGPGGETLQLSPNFLQGFDTVRVKKVERPETLQHRGSLEGGRGDDLRKALAAELQLDAMGRGDLMRQHSGARERVIEAALGMPGSDREKEVEELRAREKELDGVIKGIEKQLKGKRMESMDLRGQMQGLEATRLALLSEIDRSSRELEAQRKDKAHQLQDRNNALAQRGPDAPAAGSLQIFNSVLSWLGTASSPPADEDADENEFPQAMGDAEGGTFMNPGTHAGRGSTPAPDARAERKAEDEHGHARSGDAEAGASDEEEGGRDGGTEPLAQVDSDGTLQEHLTILSSNLTRLSEEVLQVDKEVQTELTKLGKLQEDREAVLHALRQLTGEGQETGAADTFSFLLPQFGGKGGQRFLQSSARGDIMAGPAERTKRGHSRNRSISHLYFF